MENASSKTRAPQVQHILLWGGYQPNHFLHGQWKMDVLIYFILPHVRNIPRGVHTPLHCGIEPLACSIQLAVVAGRYSENFSLIMPVIHQKDCRMDSRMKFLYIYIYIYISVY